MRISRAIEQAIAAIADQFCGGGVVGPNHRPARQHCFRCCSPESFRAGAHQGDIGSPQLRHGIVQPAQEADPILQLVLAYQMLEASAVISIAFADNHQLHINLPLAKFQQGQHRVLLAFVFGDGAGDDAAIPAIAPGHATVIPEGAMQGTVNHLRRRTLQPAVDFAGHRLRGRYDQGGKPVHYAM